MPSNTHVINLRPWRMLAGLARLIALASIVSCFGFSACATQATPGVQRTQAVGLTLTLSDRDQRLDSLQTPAIMEYSGPGGHLKAREQIIVRRPASLRVEALSPLGVALIVAADGGHIAVFEPSHDTLMRGPATAATLERFARIPMAPQQAVRLLLGLSPDSAMLAFAPSAIRDEGAVKILSYARANGSIDELGFAERHLVLARERTRSGQLAYEVYYKDYRDIGGIEFPYELQASFPAAGTTVKLRYEKPIIDGQISDSLFVLSPGPKTRQVDIGLNAFESASDSKG
jgi:hypothetical protein